jgi:hypothetical protein
MCRFVKASFAVSACAVQQPSVSGMNSDHCEGLWLIACIARLLLHDAERNTLRESNMTSAEYHRISDIESDIAASMLGLARSVGSTGRCSGEEVSPFCLEAMYRAGIFYARRFQNTGEQSHLESFESIKTGFTIANDRWKASGMLLFATRFPQRFDGLLFLGTYLKMLEARSLTGIL